MVYLKKKMGEDKKEIILVNNVCNKYSHLENKSQSGNWTENHK